MSREQHPMMKMVGLGVAALAGAVAGGALVKKLWLEKYRWQKETLKEINGERDLLYTWLRLKVAGARLSEYFTENGCQSIAVLGMGREGRFFLEQLAEEGEISAAYGVEADYFSAVHETLTVYRLGEDPLPSADCLVVCDLCRTKEKIGAAREEFSNRVVTLEQVLNWLAEKHSVKPWRGQSTSSRPAK